MAPRRAERRRRYLPSRLSCRHPWANCVSVTCQAVGLCQSLHAVERRTCVSLMMPLMQFFRLLYFWLANVHVDLSTMGIAYRVTAPVGPARAKPNAKHSVRFSVLTRWPHGASCANITPKRKLLSWQYIPDETIKQLLLHTACNTRAQQG